MKIHTSRFGELDIPEDTLLHFPAGLVGLPSAQRFVVLDVDKPSVYQWLQAIDEPGLAFILIDIDLLEPTFQVELPDEALEEIGYQDHHPLSLMAIVAIPNGKPEEATANLRAPLVINAETRKGKQIVLHETVTLHYSIAKATVQPEPAPAVASEVVSVP